MSTWQPIETAPKDGTFILAVVQGVHGLTGKPFYPLVTSWEDGIWSDEISRGCDCYEGVYEPTHWMPLPEPPQP